MTSEVEVDEEERWAEAESILRVQPTEDAGRRTRRRRALVWSLIGGLTVLGVGLGVLVVVFLGSYHHARHPEPTGWQVAAGFTLSGCAVVLMAWLFFLRVRRGRGAQAYRSPAVALTRRQRRYLMDQIRGRRQADPRRLALGRDLAQRLEEQVRFLVPFHLAIVLGYVGNAVSSGSVGQLWFAVACLICWVLYVALGGRQARWARRFLQEHPALED